MSVLSIVGAIAAVVNIIDRLFAAVGFKRGELKSFYDSVMAVFRSGDDNVDSD